MTLLLLILRARILGVWFWRPSQDLPVVDQRLRPAELAYLSRQGDMSNTMAVLAFDLLHRAVKGYQPGPSTLDLAPYEINLWLKVKDYVAVRAQDEVSKILPDPRSESLLKVVNKLAALYRFVLVTIREFVSKIISDPRKLKRYFSFAGIARLTADFCSAGYQKIVETEMMSDLIDRGLLLSDARRKQRADRLFKVAALAAVFLVLLLSVMWGVYIAAVAFVLSAVSALCLHSFLGLADFIPLYSELRDILKHVNRAGWRLPLVRVAVTLVNGLVLGGLILIAVVLQAIDVAVLCFLFHLLLADAVVLVTALTVGLIAVVDVILLSHRMQWHPQPSTLAQSLITSQRKRLAGVSPLSTFRQVLLTADYDPLFSELLALYGIETLWMLA